MTTDTPSPDDDPRVHTTEPAEGAETPGDPTATNERPSEPSEGKDPTGS